MITLTVASFNGAPLTQPLTAHFDEMGGNIGRADNNQLVLPDPERTISRVHAQVVFRGGRYAIVDLRPGTYTVTFTLAGFSTIKRDGIIVPSNVTVPINADLRVGAIEETVTVSGSSPVVDVQNVSKLQVMTRDLMDAIPSARNMQAIGALVGQAKKKNANVNPGRVRELLMELLSKL